MLTVSIRLLTYNHERFIEDAIKGILIQRTNFKVEVVIGDDFSIDRTIQILRNVENTSHVIFKILNRPRNGVYHKSRNELGRPHNFYDTLSHCSGKYVALLDGDDYWTDPFKLQKQVDFLEKNPDFVISFHDCFVVDEDGNVLSKSRVKNKDKIREPIQIISGAHIPTSTVLFRNENFKLPNEFYDVDNLDNFFFSSIAEFGKAYFDNSISPSGYRKNANSVWSKLDKGIKYTKSYKTFSKILSVSDKKYRLSLYKKLLRISYRGFKYNRLFSREKVYWAMKILQNLPGYFYYLIKI